MKLTGPLAVPPPAIFSRLERIVDRLLPAPEPNLKSIASVLARSMMLVMESWTELMKQLWTATLFERYSPDSVWMSYTGSTPRSSIATISSSRMLGTDLRSRSPSEASSRACLSRPTNPTSSAKRARSDP